MFWFRAKENVIIAVTNSTDILAVSLCSFVKKLQALYTYFLSDQRTGSECMKQECTYTFILFD